MKWLILLAVLPLVASLLLIALAVRHQERALVRREAERTPTERRALKARAHPLEPVAMIGDQGLTAAVIREIDRSLKAHELIKVRVNGEDREERSAAIQMIAAQTRAQIVQIIGKIVLLYRPARKPSPKLSNLLRYSHLKD